MQQSLKSDNKKITLRSLLESYREQTTSNAKKGKIFEDFVSKYLMHDPLHYGRYEKVESYFEWAKERKDWNKNDIGIDLVAKLRNQEGYVAIQCKFYKADHQISKKDIDSFIAASGKDIFKYRLLVDSTESELTDNVNAMIKGQSIPVYRIDLRYMENSRIDWQIFATKQEVVLKSTKEPRTHQEEAIKKVCEGLKESDRGKLIMACGTGKTFTSLKIAEQIAGKGKRVLFLVPSLALVSQTIREWTADAQVPLRSFAVCSDTKVGKRRKNQDDIVGMETSDLVLPATTDAKALAKEACENFTDAMTVIFSTYHSIQVISDAQKDYGLSEFDLIICDEAHRTTGTSLGSEDNESEFVKVHDNSIIRGKKRLYMTATPRIFSETAKRRADEINAVLASMDDEVLFGKQLHHYSFAEAVDNELLTPYKIVVLGIDETYITPAIQEIIANENREIDLDDAAKIIGCYRALTKIDKEAAVDNDDTEPMQCALAFCKDINTSKYVTKLFNKIIKSHINDFLKNVPFLNCEVRHIDGKQSVKKRNEELDWLKQDAGKNVCRILSNVRCLSEGIDVPALDAIMFLHPRNSQVDVIQAVGRVMRRAPNKKTGYIILPIIIPSHLEAKKALRNNKKYRVVWQVLHALHSHDERLARTINQMSLGQDSSHTIEIIEVKRADELKELTTTVDDVTISSKAESSGRVIGTAASKSQSGYNEQKDLFRRSEFFDFIKAIFLDSFKITDYWGIWAGNVAEIAQNHITHLQNLLADETSEAFHAFDAFHKELQNNVNSAIKQEEAIEMLAQHLVTRPVFEALFEGNEFVQNNAISQAMDKILRELDKTNIEEKTKDLDKFYKSVTFCTAGITETHAKQNLIIKLYESFFTKAFKKTTDRLGIVYTPIEVVDFIIHSVDDVLRNEFGKSLGSRGVSILDPFTGTGTFITRLLQSNLIKPEDMEYKFRHDIHANEIVLLAYYIAAINIESTYHSLVKGEYIPFKHIGLTDTFQMLEEKNLLQKLFKENSEYLEHQKNLDIKVIFGNPPYSMGQKSENDNAKNTPYPILDDRIRETYAVQSKATNIRSLYDSYIRAIRWASDRIKDRGVIGFVTNASFVDTKSMDGLRKCLVEEFSSLYIFHLRGNQRTSGELSRQEGGKIFGSGSRAPIAISILVKNPESQQRGKIYFHAMEDYFTREKKLKTIKGFGSIDGITRENNWQIITPDRHGDWINQRDESFKTFLALGVKKGHDKKLFTTFSCGVQTSRDAWAYNSSHKILETNMHNTITFYNSEVKCFNDAYGHVDRRIRKNAVDNFVNSDTKKISWSSSLKEEFVRGKFSEFESNCLVQSLYRPFTKQWLYYNRIFNHRVFQMPHIFPMGQVVENKVIQITGIGAKCGFSALMYKNLPNSDSMEKGQCFPRYIYEDTTVSKSKSEKQSHLFLISTEESKNAGLQRRDAITDEGLAHFKAAYPNETITKDDLFYYVYGLLHSEDYRTRYADNLSKELPRIPCVKSAEDFWMFVTAGRELGHLHVNYEDVEPYPLTFKKGNPKQTDISNPEKFYYVTEMKFFGNSKEKDKSTVIYNSNIIMTDIPLEAYEYIVNGKPALEWVMERQCVKTDKKSGIVNDANRYAVETVGNPAYPLELFQRVITVSLETMKIVKNLPKLEIRETE
ncbi:DEAD/DEAH box helicase family protein [Bartonella krasnovii]|uniref:DEAD/DEAH box helicase n=1 Tax=Bartonella krasnovii TaxID=2267275 RepID=UPI001F4CE4A8|nr:type ISP restriction/modification enzyme [Bartonella krasnovii]UNF37695.1 DEAD/DEAH box helicase family protein [Bartonella krasnovii]UNF42736.1 DEAD/DEAH box helicase family protein [Bartonella krasnovii]UNF55946.1 DEAD/DEAH box helicase family protein [Bartonella krasnovii]